MKSLLKLIIILQVMAMQMQAQKCASEMNITCLNPISFNQVFEAGKPNSFKQMCPSKGDSILNGTVLFDKASILTVKNCKKTIRIVADTIRMYKLETTTTKNTSNLVKEVLASYGKPHEIHKDNTSNTITYLWSTPYQYKQFIVSKLVVGKKQKTGMLISKIIQEI